MNRKKDLEDGDERFLKKSEKLNQVWTAQASLTWWQTESSRLHEEAKQIEWDYEHGHLSEEEAVKAGQEIESKILYLEKKGQFERKVWENLEK
jgi:hypothetical protein